MTGDHQTPVTPDSAAKFGADRVPDTKATLFGEEDITKILNQNRHAQDHIKTLETETATMRAELQRMQEELARSKSIDDLLATMQQQNTNEPGTTSPQLDQAELLNTLKDEVFKDLSLAQQRSLEMENWNKSVNALREQHGDGYASYVDRRAMELDIPVAKMEELAKTSPKAFIELVSPGTKRTPTPTMSGQSVPLNQDATLDAMFSRIQKLRQMNTPEGREAKAQWEDPGFQKQYRQYILEKAKKAGSTYGNNI